MLLSNATLDAVPKDVLRPTYDRSRITPGIVHIGLGNFHRAHQSWYLHRLMQQGEAMDWGIIGAGVRPGDDAQRQRLAAQDYLTTLIELDPKGRSAEIVGAMIGFVPVQEDNAALIARMADPAIRIVSLTVTEGGYYIDPVTKAFNADHPDMRHDAAHPDHPRTAFGAMISALGKRRDAGLGPFTGQSCDNLQGNGAILRQTLVSLARMSDPQLADWIEKNCTFPNSMVDCIVPATGPKELELVRTFGIEDAAPVTHENYRQWVIEDKFCAGRPDWDKVGATFTDDVYSFEAMKIRILNGGHQLIADAGEILSVEFISGCMNHPLIGAYFRKTVTTEIAPHVADVPGTTAQAYAGLISQRFSNPEIVDTVRRVAFDGSSRQTGFILPSLRDALAKGAAMQGLALSQAIWARMCEGTREDGTTIQPNDPIWAQLNKAAQAARSNPQVWLNQRDLYGELADNIPFQRAFVRWLKLIWSDGLEATLRSYLQGQNK
ncbi:mannitol dehydrogenase family protein [Paracoccus seriniphilus]|uniref:Mannitol 2-dehydrogenase n=1 Tax=Paracoccus seriniphilus TaxID=184748 RepID=A0A239Q1G4_9RHOB|nr:mannitol dehydrogenase family protein [Paracoccus seriniphilus]WCR15103.1 mannitol dehydrogenase family protein [Paracoccus seriniphilus]SNT76083.1 mannitol 2-dehydrogenase [Paracoccus seriniphilus]